MTKIPPSQLRRSRRIQQLRQRSISKAPVSSAPRLMVKSPTSKTIAQRVVLRQPIHNQANSTSSTSSLSSPPSSISQHTCPFLPPPSVDPSNLERQTSSEPQCQAPGGPDDVYQPLSVDDLHQLYEEVMEFKGLQRASGLVAPELPIA